jgi:hypothetical protein
MFQVVDGKLNQREKKIPVDLFVVHPEVKHLFSKQIDLLSMESGNLVSSNAMKAFQTDL